MQTIQLQVEDNKLDTILHILSNLKDDLIQKLEVKEDIISVSDEENNYYKELLNKMSENDKIVSSKEVITIWD